MCYVLASHHCSDHWEKGRSRLGLTANGGFCERSLENQSQILGSSKACWLKHDVHGVRNQVQLSQVLWFRISYKTANKVLVSTSSQVPTESLFQAYSHGRWQASGLLRQLAGVISSLPLMWTSP